MGVPCCLCVTLEEVFTDPHLEANDLWWRSEHGLLGPFQQIGRTVKWDEHSMRLERPAPLFAEHSREVLLDFGIEPGRIEGLIERAIVLTTEQAAPAIKPYETTI